MSPRRYTLYVESRDRHSPGVSPELAKSIITTARERLRPFLGSLTITREITSFDLPATSYLGEQAFLPPDRRAILLTTKEPYVPGAPRAVGVRRQYTYANGNVARSHIIAQVSHTMTNTSDMIYNAASVLSHEVCHDYEIGHCAVVTCLMAEAQQSDNDGAMLMKIPNPFCRDHRDELAAISGLPKVPLTSEVSPIELHVSLGS